MYNMKDSVQFLTNSVRLNTLINFLKHKDLIYMAIAVYLGLVLQNFLESLAGDIVIPLATAPLPEKIKDINLNVLGMDVNRFVVKLLSFFIAVFVSYLFMKLVMRH
jgi:large-conductance mechanosensitive channel